MGTQEGDWVDGGPRDRYSPLEFYSDEMETGGISFAAYTVKYKIIGYKSNSIRIELTDRAILDFALNPALYPEEITPGSHQRAASEEGVPPAAEEGVPPAAEEGLPPNDDEWQIPRIPSQEEINVTRVALRSNQARQARLAVLERRCTCIEFGTDVADLDPSDVRVQIGDSTYSVVKIETFRGEQIQGEEGPVFGTAVITLPEYAIIPDADKVIGNVSVTRNRRGDFIVYSRPVGDSDDELDPDIVIRRDAESKEGEDEPNSLRQTALRKILETGALAERPGIVTSQLQDAGWPLAELVEDHRQNKPEMARVKVSFLDNQLKADYWWKVGRNIGHKTLMDSEDDYQRHIDEDRDRDRDTILYAGVIQWDSSGRIQYFTNDCEFVYHADDRDAEYFMSRHNDFNELFQYTDCTRSWKAVCGKCRKYFPYNDIRKWDWSRHQVLKDDVLYICKGCFEDWKRSGIGVPRGCDCNPCRERAWGWGPASYYSLNCENKNRDPGSFYDSNEKSPNPVYLNDGYQNPMDRVSNRPTSVRVPEPAEGSDSDSDSDSGSEGEDAF